MSVHPTLSFDTELQRAVYEYVERNGAVEPDELARSIQLESEPAHSKPARSGSYTESICPSMDDLESCLEALQTQGYLAESDGKFRVALSTTPITVDLEDGTVTIRAAQEEDRRGVIDTMRAVAREGTYIVAENVATQLEGESALVRANEDRSRVFFVAVFEPSAAADDEDGTADDADGDARVVGWLHIDANELPSLSHTAELTVGVAADMRHDGIGSQLLEYGLEWAKNAGYRKVYQNVPATNEGAIEFLEANGWQREGEHEDQYRIDDAFVDEIMLATWP
ncbi:GNAT family N-acetyltransferase [Natronorubrum thiooxidans]|uniref:Ribosomal protein S18 acetylase RimI n=1 Tax=Natronorubrum thiooxidans TaxID=308853 RepID=A0A1N7DAA3_9EURY|nr:GNAT family N-acetyltransferase [Natronorubrum thiooxidans]SIR72760.1 Ribosomal protein S18 acetylase RimI [Natronorubrum thiooxidans]